MKRWAICKMIEVAPQEIDPAIAKYPGSWRIIHVPGRNWVLCQFSSINLTPIQADPDIYILPDGAFDMSVGSIPAAVRTTLRTKCEAAGFVFTDVKTSWTVRQLLNYLGSQIQQGFSCESGDVKE